MDGHQRFATPDTLRTARTGSSTTPTKKPFSAYCVTSNPKSCHRRDRNRTGESTAPPHSERLSAEDAMPYRLGALTHGLRNEVERAQKQLPPGGMKRTATF